MKAQPVLYKYIILLNWRKERTSLQFKFLKLNLPFTTCFCKSRHMDSSPKIKKLQPLKNVFEHPKDALIVQGEDTMMNTSLIQCNSYIIKLHNHLLVSIMKVQKEINKLSIFNNWLPLGNSSCWNHVRLLLLGNHNQLPRSILILRLVVPNVNHDLEPKKQ